MNNLNPIEYLIRALGYIKSLEDLEKCVITIRADVPVFLKDVARINLGPASRRGGLDKDGVEAVALLQEQLPNIMLLDIEMPRMDGFELASYIRNDERLKDLPIIMITSRTGEKHKERAMEIGVNEYLGKPYQEEELLKNINNILQA